MALQHQKLVIQIDLDERELHGFTDLTFAQLTADHIYLNARQIKINSIAALLPDENGNERAGSVVDIPDFVYEDTLSRPGDGTIESRPESAEPVKSFSDLDSSYHLQLRRRLLLEKRRVDAQGEVYVPLKSILDLTPQNSDSTNPDDGDGNNNTENEGMAGVEQQQNDAPRILFESLTIRVSFSLISPTVGAYFFDSNSSRTEANHLPYMYAWGNNGDARTWFPCVDNADQRCTWDMQFITTRFIRPAAKNSENFDTIVVSNGDLVKQVMHLDDTSLKVVHYEITIPTCASSISVCVGPFSVRSVSNCPQSCTVMTFCLPGSEEKMELSNEFLGKAYEFFSDYCGASFPFTSYKTVFLPDLAADKYWSGSTVSLLSVDCLHDGTAIEEVFDSRRTMSKMLATQWFGQYIFPRAFMDYWLTIGLAYFLSGLFVRHHFGNGEYRIRLLMDIETLSEIDHHKNALYSGNPSQFVFMDDYQDSKLLQIKSPIIISMLERYLGKNVMQKALNKILVAAISGELSSGLSTAYFLRLLKKVSGKDPTDFAEQWIFSPGMPILNCEYFFSRKKNAIELRVRQDTTRPRYIGPLTVRVHEPTGTFDHVVNISEYNQKFELLYHTKYKRIRNSKKAQVLAAQDEAEKDKQESILGLRPPAGTEADEEMCRTDPELLAELNKTEEETDHAESEEISEINSSIAWIRFDPNLELPCKIVCKQTEFAWIQQLYRDKDVIAQFEAAKNLSNYPSEKSCYCLFKLLMDVRSNYRVRMEAAYALAKGFRGTDQEIKVFNLLALAFRKKFSIQKSIDVPLPDIVPRRNDFSAFTEYFVQKAIIMSFSLICTSENTEIVGDIQKFIVSQLQLNDNSQNSFSDHNYIASLILALGYSFLPPSVWDWDSSSTQHGQQWVTNVISERASSELLDEAMKEIYRYLFLETQIPSAQNVVARACLEVLVNWSLSSLIPVRIQHFILFSNRENFAGVRIHSFEAIIVFAGHNRSVSNYLMDTMENDFDLNIRIAVAKCLNRWLRALTRLLVNFEKFALSNMQQKSLESSNFDIEDLANESLESESSSRKLKQKIENILQSYRDNFKTWIWKCLTKNVIINENFRCILLDICDALYEPFQSEPMLITDEYIDEERELEIARPKRKFMPDEIDEDLDRNKRSKFTDEEKSEPVKAVIRLPLANIAPVLEEINSVSAKPDLDKLKKAHIKLQQHPLSPPFLYPVDVTLYPDYSILVSEPMDLSTSKLKINRNRYKTVDEWASDIYLIFSNCSKYNREDSAIVAQSKILLEYFNNILLPFVKGEIEDIPEENCVLAGQSSDEHDITLMEYAKAHEMVAKFTLHPNAYFFSVPVDPQRDGAPDYFDIIKYPMDFGTIQKKLNQRAYSNINEFENDVRLVFNNCYTYNKSSKTVVYQTAKALERLWEREWFRFKVQNNMDQPNDIVTPPQIEEPQEASESDCLFAEKESLLSLTDKIMASPYAFPFLQPVDWKALCLFDYPRVIKMPMDLGTIRSKIVGDLYKKLEEFELDMCLVFENCFKYNSKGSSVYASAKSLQLEFRMYWDRFRHGERDFRSLICERPVEGDVLSLRRFLHGIRQKLVEHPSSLWFRLPVDPVAQNVPTYFDVITHPMDLHTLGMKIQSGTYDYDAGKFASDVRLIFQNCYKFNGVDSGPSQEAKMLEEYFDSIWNEFENKG